VDLWADNRLPSGAEWEREIEAALTSAKVAVLLISPAFLASEFIWESEMSGAGISFSGKYYGFVTGNQMSGGWFSGTRLVGLFTLERNSSTR
jgi:hypothetical protein